MVLFVERISELLEEHHSVAVDAGVLPFCHYGAEHFINIGHIEVAAHEQIARPPVVAAQERMHI